MIFKKKIVGHLRILSFLLIYEIDLGRTLQKLLHFLALIESPNTIFNIRHVGPPLKQHHTNFPFSKSCTIFIQEYLWLILKL